MPSVNTNRLLYFLVLLTAVVLGFVLSGFQAGSWVPYVMIGIGSLSLGLLLTLLFVRNAGITVSWPALIAMGVVVTLMSTALFKRLRAEPVPTAVEAVVTSLQEHQQAQGTFPSNLDPIEMTDFPGAVKYVRRQQGEAFTLRYIPDQGSVQTYRSDVGEWTISD